MVAILTLATGAAEAARTFTVVNSCSFTIWYIFTDLHVATNVPDFPTGWEAGPGTTFEFQVPDNWKAGRIWGRRDCDFAGNMYGGPSTCLSGGCNGGYQCDPHTGIGVPPVTLAQWNLDEGGSDWYYISLIDGFNLPMSNTNNVGCPVAECAVDLVRDCPKALEGPYTTNGWPIGCKSACLANLNGNQANSPDCCTGQYSTPKTCPASGVTFRQYFKSSCPSALTYAYDDAALLTCPSYNSAGYTVTFCP
ncbi:hypothetical protein M413DRAFT_19912 [Hebeloma cylindrosporum]|uniref:Osmotin, thaumatin-like protein n=1 Tax=Hebeloma cylindrosporum TaxID=76867 RepID=A0A0C2YCR2_HEBCY|nr:hypothetical protein M413DRAFT_19912 [Hebeloma cylindrosporum h7]